MEYEKALEILENYKAWLDHSPSIILENSREDRMEALGIAIEVLQKVVDNGKLPSAYVEQVKAAKEIIDKIYEKIV